MSPSRNVRLVDRVEEEAAELHGKGVALSVDEDEGSPGEGKKGWRVRLWDRAGLLIEESELGTKEQALRDMMRRLTS